MSVERPTNDEVDRVHAWECSQRGHDTEIVESMGTPVAIACTHCGERWTVSTRPASAEPS